MPGDYEDLQALQAARDEVDRLRMVLGGSVTDATRYYLQELKSYREALRQICENPDQALLIAHSVLDLYEM